MGRELEGGWVLAHGPSQAQPKKESQHLQQAPKSLGKMYVKQWSRTGALPVRSPATEARYGNMSGHPWLRCSGHVQNKSVSPGHSRDIYGLGWECLKWEEVAEERGASLKGCCPSDAARKICSLMDGWWAVLMWIHCAEVLKGLLTSNMQKNNNNN